MDPRDASEEVRTATTNNWATKWSENTFTKEEGNETTRS